jgi:hypothetical protein
MPDVEIRETTIGPDADGAIVRLQLSDAPLLSESATIRIDLSVRLPEYKLPLLAHFQREAMQMAIEVLRKLDREIDQDIQETSHTPRPIPKR